LLSVISTPPLDDRYHNRKIGDMLLCNTTRSGRAAQ
jgi:hypothetical protein